MRCLKAVILDVSPGIPFAGVGPSAGPFDLMSAHAFLLQAMIIPPHGVILDVNTCILLQAMVIPPHEG